MTISKFYHDSESNSVIDLSLITSIDSIEIKESSISTPLKRTFWQWLRGEKHEKHEYKYAWEYGIQMLSDRSRLCLCEYNTRDYPFTDREKSEIRKDAKEHQEKLIKALQEYDIANKNLNSNNEER